MPRNGSSEYSLPAGNPVIAGTVIATTWANTTLTDIATALTNSLSTDGSTASVSLSGKTMAGGTFSGPSVTGVLTLTGGQIAFPAVQIPSANANTLDDYEEGTWTPVMTFANPGNTAVAYSTRVGTYTKIGRLVSLNCALGMSTWTHTTATGNITITGQPFASIDTSAQGAGRFSGLAISTVGFPIPYGLNPTPIIDISAANNIYFEIPGINSSANVVLGVGNHVSGNTGVAYVSIVYQTT